MDHRKLDEMIDSCRPGSDDLGLPEMSPLADRIEGDPELHERFQRTQRLDARLVRAIDDIAVPTGLHERILAQIDSERLTQGQRTSDQVAENQRPDNQRPDDDGVALHSPTTRRRWFRSIAAVAASLVLLATGYAVWPHHPALTYDKLLNLSSDWYQQLRTNPAWQPLSPRAAIRDFPVAEAIRRQPRRWADVSSLVGQAACAYDLTAVGRPATLFVISDSGQIVGSAVPFKPGSSTGGLMIGCWQSGDLIYVLVVEGDERAYRSLLDDAGPPLAQLQIRDTMATSAGNLSLDCPVG